MMFRGLIVALITAASSAPADTLAQMEGTWRGAGWAKETLQGPQETVRCQITNSYDAQSLTLTLTGQCVVPGRRLAVNGTLKGKDGTERITGSWSNPDGIGSAPVVGFQRGNIVAFNFNTIDLATGRKVAQNVEWQLVEADLRLRSTDRNHADVMMSDISFTR